MFDSSQPLFASVGLVVVWECCLLNWLCRTSDESIGLSDTGGESLEEEGLSSIRSNAFITVVCRVKVKERLS